MPDILTLVDANDGATISATQNGESFEIEAQYTGGKRITVWLTEQQARRLYGRLAKYFREIK